MSGSSVPSEVAEAYDTFLRHMDSDDFIRQMHNEPFNTEGAEIRELVRNSQTVISLLAKFVLDQRGTWSHRFLEQILFC